MASSDRLPRRIPLAKRRALVARYTRLQPLRDVPDVRLHLADEVEPLWRALETTGWDPGVGLPYWAFAWAGGLGLARHLVEHPKEVAGRSVLDLGTGSGLCAITARLVGADAVLAADIDPFAQAATALNARENQVRIPFIDDDLLDAEPPDLDVILAGDLWYEGPLAERVVPWLALAADRGTRILAGDPGRRYFPPGGFVEVAAYDVHTTTAFDDRPVVTARVFTIEPAA